MTWTNIEELELVKQLNSNIPIDTIAKNLNKTKVSIDIKLNKIIYDNMKKHNDIKMISQKLNLTENDASNRYKIYESYKKEYDEKRGNKQLTDDNESNNSEDVDKKIEKLEKENKLIKLLLDNKKLHCELRNQIDKKNVNSSIYNLIKKIRDV